MPLFGIGSEKIRLNQIGFYEFGPKRAIVVSTQAWRFSIKSTDLSTTYYAGDLTLPKKWDAAQETVSIADFSYFTRKGTYVLDVNGIGTSYPFQIGPSVHKDLVFGLIKSFYYQRASTSLPEQYAGRWNRSSGHPDTRVTVHYSAASNTSSPNSRKTGDFVASPGGWYDAGDYGKYVVNAGITTYTLLSLYEQFPEYFNAFSLNIPQSPSGLPDLLAEIKWELDWLLTMQDPSDGSVNHKLTSLDFCGFLMPENDLTIRYLIGKSSNAAFDFAAVCAVAARIYKKLLPSFADSCLAAAEKAWLWGMAHPNMLFKNPSDVKTGMYGDNSAQDEQNWAANELYLATGDTLYFSIGSKPGVGFPVPGWPNVSMLGMYSLSRMKNDSAARSQIIYKAKQYCSFADNVPYRIPLQSSGDFYWGSNGVAANDGMLFIEAFLASGDVMYLERAVDVLDYLMGRNAVGYSFVTGYGTKSAFHPHHRPSVADGIDDPVPGFLVGGPNASLKRDEAIACGANAYDGIPAAKLWIDADCSYGSNEVAINWNAAAAFLAGAIEAIYTDASFHVRRYAADTVVSAIDSVSLTRLSSDRAAIEWTSNKKVSASVLLGTDSALSNALPQFSGGTTRHCVDLSGLAPATTYYYRLLSIDDFGASASSAIRTFTTKSSPLVEHFQFDPSLLTGTAGTDLSVSFAAGGGLTAKLLYAEGGHALTNAIPCTEDNGVYRAVIPASNVTMAGLLVSIELAATADTLSSPVYAIPMSGQAHYGDSLPFANTYYQISFPLLGPARPAPEFLKAQLGNPAGWRYYGYDPRRCTYSQDDSVGQCRGGWLFVRQKSVLDLETAALRPDTIVPILLSQGWNCVGSPFPFPLFWENSFVRYEGAVMRLFDGAARQLIRRQWFHYVDTTADLKNNGDYLSNRDVLAFDTTRLVPWNGYWVYAEKNGIELLLNPAAGPPKTPLAKKHDMAPQQWNVRFSVQINGNVDNMAVVGEAPDALDGYDELDSPKPPSLSDEAIIGLLNPQWGKADALYASDIAAYRSAAGHTWHMAVKTKKTNQRAEISWRVSGSMNGFLYLYDPVADATVDVRSGKTYSIAFLPNEFRRVFTIALSPSADMRFSSVPTLWSLRRNVPDPFRLSTSIPFSVPGGENGNIRPRMVTIAVFDILGRRVRTLVNEARLPGNHAVVWNGTDDRSRRLHQGVYIVRLSAGGFSGSLKTHVID